MKELYRRLIEKLNIDYDSYSIGNATLQEIVGECLADEAEKAGITLTEDEFSSLLRKFVAEERQRAVGHGYKGMWRVDLYNMLILFPKDARDAINQDIRRTGGERSLTFFSHIITAEVLEELSPAMGYRHPKEGNKFDFLAWVTKGKFKSKRTLAN